MAPKDNDGPDGRRFGDVLQFAWLADADLYANGRRDTDPGVFGVVADEPVLPAVTYSIYSDTCQPEPVDEPRGAGSRQSADL
ncbi:MAG: hypothetical protein AAF936_03510 [Pseudomonadota bacterium]